MGRVITKHEADKLHAQFMQASRDLYILRQWMERQKFTLDDPLFRLTFAAQYAMHQFVDELHKRAHAMRLLTNLRQQVE